MPPISRRQGWQPWRIKDAAAEVTTEQNLRPRVVFSLAAAKATWARNSATIQVSVLLRRRLGVKDPAAIPPPDSTAQTHVRQPLGAQQTTANIRARHGATIQADILLRRRLGVKDPSALPPPDNTAQTKARTLGAAQANQASAARKSAAIQAGRLLRRQSWAWRKSPAAEVTTEQNLRAQRPIGNQQAVQLARRSTQSGQQAAGRMLRQNAWLAPFDGVVYVGEVHLTEIKRTTIFNHLATVTLTEPTRIRSFTEASL